MDTARDVKHCPIRERTADGVAVGRCWFYLPDARTCPRHGDVAEAVRKFAATGKLTDEMEARPNGRR